MKFNANMELETKEIIDELRKIRIGIEFLKANLPDKEMFLTVEEEILLKNSYENEEKGRLVSSNELKKELEI